jgi:hypothetical protein
VPSLPDRPSALTPDVQRRIIEHVANGNYYEVACRAAGTTKQAVDYWRKLVEQKVEHSLKYADFFDALARANALAEANAVARISQGGRDWQGPAWFVERRFHARWGNKDKVKKHHGLDDHKPGGIVIPPDDPRHEPEPEAPED